MNLFQLQSSCLFTPIPSWPRLDHSLTLKRLMFRWDDKAFWVSKKSSEPRVVCLEGQLSVLPHISQCLFPPPFPPLGNEGNRSVFPKIPVQIEQNYILRTQGRISFPITVHCYYESWNINSENQSLLCSLSQCILFLFVKQRELRCYEGTWLTVKPQSS